MPESSLKLMTPAEAAARLSVSPITLRSWTEKGLIEAQVTAGGHRRYPVREIERLLQRQSQSLSAPLRIMIVDDDVLILKILQRFLTELNKPVLIELANDGFEAGRKVITFKPDIILLDLMMPKIDGFDVCGQVKSNPITSSIRVIAMTADPSKENTQRILSMGAEACLSKPLDPSHLLELLDLN